jgi:hypothetical protein
MVGCRSVVPAHGCRLLFYYTATRKSGINQMKPAEKISCQRPIEAVRISFFEDENK